MGGQLGKIEYCGECGAKIVEYKHNLSKGLIRVLREMARVGGEAKFDDLPVTYSDKCNAQKLQYWDLIKHQQKGQPWLLSLLAYDFLAGRVRLHRTVKTYRGARLEYLGQLVSITDVDPTYRIREDYLEDLEPHQLELPFRDREPT